MPLKFRPLRCRALALACAGGLASALLCGCAAVAPRAAPPVAAEAAARSVAAKGRISATATNERGSTQQLSGSFELSIDGDSGQLMLLTPLGSTVAVLGWSRDGALLKRADGSVEAYASAQDMIASTLGAPVAPAMLKAWLFGTPIDGVTVDSIGPGHFSQLGWDVSFTRGDDGQVRRLLISRSTPEPAELRLVLDEVR
jgi:outer membrane lipoprotein LolB